MNDNYGKKKVAVLISGSGTNLQALIDACEHPGFPAQIVLVLSNKADAFGLERAKKAGLATQVLSHTDYADREAYDGALHEAIVACGAEIVCLAGFMRLLTEGFVNRWAGCMLNIHPSLLPAYKGLHTHQRAIEAGEKQAGCTVHFVSPEMDEGPIILQASVPVEPGDTPESLAKRVLAEEHKLYPQALRLLAEGRLSIKDGKVVQV